VPVWFGGIITCGAGRTGFGRRFSAASMARVTYVMRSNNHGDGAHCAGSAPAY
jgi:hypothetical protein